MISSFCTTPGKHRYLVLRLGFVYYFENDRSKQPKGHFSLYNCRLDDDIIVTSLCL